MVSPCILVCTLDDASGWCLGCGRTGDEIARWTAMQPAERDAVMAMLPARMARLADQ
ncbi:DUF1289 domain-containing protein [Sphingomonas baiyangensis]|uniref:DUF1289 domain-containing protein n=2 Tax=Sphingomonas baiyangensis TaxID=2572576 RepID=A0A4U1L5I9_9SPHN|nr:DUF1289 domain-containing protein [Sphingomonas baiyangensis]